LQGLAGSTDCLVSLAIPLEDDEEDCAMTLEDDMSLRFAEDRACHELEELEAIHELDDFVSLTKTLEEESSAFTLELFSQAPKNRLAKTNIPQTFIFIPSFFKI
jgi:hypothetical protein